MSNLHRIEISVRVRYPECDSMKAAHHSVYLVWLEMARIELHRSMGTSYAAMEKRGIFFVVARLNIRYRKPAFYDNELVITCVSQPAFGAKIDHDYEIHRGDDLLVTASTTIVCVDGQGRVQPMPDDLFASVSAET